MNIYQKLIEVRKSCEYLKKDNAGFQFKYVSSSQTLGTLRAAMDQHQLLLIPSVTSHETRDHVTKKGEHEYFTIATMMFTWVNAEKPEEQIVCPWLGQGLDSGEKGVGKAMTYAEKYFLLKFFNIATDKDDPDSFQKKNDQPPEVKLQEKVQTPPPKAHNEADLAIIREDLQKDFDLKATSLELVTEWWGDNEKTIKKIIPTDSQAYKDLLAHLGAKKKALKESGNGK